jgi:phage shock protein E
MKKMMFSFLMVFVTGILFSFGQGAAPKEIGVSEFKQLMKSNEAVIMDVRTPAEISDGYIKGASVFVDVNDADFLKQISKLDKNKTYLLYCRSGMRSKNAGNVMIREGFKKVYSLQGGIMGFDGEIVKK